MSERENRVEIHCIIFRPMLEGSNVDIGLPPWLVIFDSHWLRHAWFGVKKVGSCSTDIN